MSNWRKLFNKSSTPTSHSAASVSSGKSQSTTPTPSIPQTTINRSEYDNGSLDEGSHVVLSVAGESDTVTSPPSSTLSNDNHNQRDSRKTLVPGDENAPSSIPGSSTSSINLLASEVSNMNINEEVITKNLEDTDPVLINDSESTSSKSHHSSSSLNANSLKLRPGLLTIKIYSGRSIVVPCPIKSDKSVLSKLATLGTNVNYEELSRNIESLKNTSAEDSDKIANCLPSTLQINNSTGMDKNSISTYHLVYIVLEVESSSDRISSIGGTIANPKFNSVSTFDITNPNTCSLRLSLYVRIPSSLTDYYSQSDNLVGSVVFPLTSNLTSEDVKSSTFRILNHEWKKFSNNSISDDLGSINITLDYKTIQQSTKSLSIDDFDLLKVIGKGSFGKVMQVRKKDTGKIYALKSIRKSHIVNKMEVVHTLAEKFVLSRVTSPFIVPLKFAFQSNEKLYLVLSFINGGELFYHLQQEGKFSLVRSKMYICELLSAIENLHEMNIIYRDLKPENILLDESGHIALCDFGLCKINMKLDQKTKTFCGTPEYLAPELLLGKGYTRVVDFWTLGILLYEMLTGLPPFYDEDVNKMYKKILNQQLTFPHYIIDSAKSLITGLLDRDPTKRLGTNGVEEIKSHQFFADIDWNILNNKGYIPPFRPVVKDLNDTSNISSEFTAELPKDSVANEFLSESIQRQFAGWTYNPSSSFNNENEQ